MSMLIELLRSSWQTCYMVGISSVLAILIGIPIGVLLISTRADGILQHKTFNVVLASLVNIGRSIPFIILLVAIIPFTRFIIGTSIGTTAAIVPLTVGAIPFFARIVENILDEVPQGLIEAGLAMGATPFQIICKIMIPEARVGIVNGATITIIMLVSYSAMAGVVGGGGLGDLAIRYGYQRFDINIMLVTLVILIILVQLIQVIGDFIARRLTH